MMNDQNNMHAGNEYDNKTLAEQLRQPEGSLGIKVGENMNKGNRLMNLETIRQLEIAENDNILEIGMGNGYFVKDIITAATNVTYTGCDFSETMIKEATDLNHLISGNVKFVFAHANQLPFGDSLFDKVVTVNTIYFWDDPKQILAEIRRVLKPNGTLIITLRPKYVMDQLPIVNYGFTTFTKEATEELLAGNNFRTVSATEKADVEIKVDGMMIKNAFLIVKALKMGDV